MSKLIEKTTTLSHNGVTYTLFRRNDGIQTRLFVECDGKPIGSVSSNRWSPIVSARTETARNQIESTQWFAKNRCFTSLRNWVIDSHEVAA